MKSLKAVLLAVVTAAGLSSGAFARPLTFVNCHSAAIYYEVRTPANYDAGYIPANGQRQFDVPATLVTVYIYSTPLDLDYEVNVDFTATKKWNIAFANDGGAWVLRTSPQVYAKVADGSGVSKVSGFDSMHLLLGVMFAALVMYSFRDGVRDGHAK